VIALSANAKRGSSAVTVDIAFITVSYNTLACIRQLAEFFKNLDAPFTFTFTVVDNDSRDGSQGFLQSQTEIHYLQTGGNIGYGRAINRGVTATDSKYVCVMNTDILLNREALIDLWHFLEEKPEAGVCAPRITYLDGRSQGMVFSESLFSHYANWYSKIFSRSMKVKIEKAAKPLKVDGVLGAFFLIRRSAIPAPALFDEDFFFFYEDTALAHTLMNRGVACFVIPGASIVHIGGLSRSSNSISFFYQNKYLYLRKFYGPFHARAVYLLDRARIFRKRALYSLLSRVTASERVKSKHDYYKIAWDAGRLK
jgi:N-acetylglucosaminyl-diphospho-decaprenol L-rhamnosyltransferase